MGKNTRASGKGKGKGEGKGEGKGKGKGKGKGRKAVEHDEQARMPIHSPCKLASSTEEQSQVELEIKLLEALEIYPLAKLKGVHRHFLLYGLTANFLHRSLNRQFSPDDVLKLLDRFYDLDMVKPDDEDVEIFNREEVFCLPHSYFLNEEL